MNRKIVASWVSLVLVLSFILIIVEIAPVVEAPTTWYVDDVPGSGIGNPAEDYTSIQDAINAANDGDAIYVYNGTYYENVVVNKTINLTGENKDTTIIDGGGIGDVVYINADCVNISDLTITGSGPSQFPNAILDAGIEFYFTQFSSIINCNVSNNTHGILLHNSNNNTLKKNTCYGNERRGIQLYPASNSNVISFNKVIGLGPAPLIGNIHIADESKYNIIHNNYCSKGWNGIYLIWGCNYNLVYNNTCTENRNGICPAGDSNTFFNNNLYNNEYGIFVHGAGKYNIIRNNNISNNNNYGLYFISNYYNSIFHNNFINNSNQAYDTGINYWNKSYPYGGNFWSDYTGDDNFSGPNQDIPGSDGIGDTEYTISGGTNVDYYPLMKPRCSVLSVCLDIDPDTLNFKSKGKWITCYIELPEGYDVRAIDASSILLENSLPPILDQKYGFVKSEDSYIMDHDNDTIPERMVKFDRSDVEDMLSPGTYILKVSGKLVDGTSFEGYSDEIRVIDTS